MSSLPPFSARSIAPLTGWSPLSLDSTEQGAWWTARRPDLISLNVSAVTDWRDAFFGYTKTQAVGASRPLYDPLGFITGDGTAQELTLAPVPATIPTAAAPGAIYILGKCTALVGDTGIKVPADVGNGANGRREVFRSVVGGVIRGSGSVGTGAATPTATNTSVDLGADPHVFCLTYDGASVSLEVDGTLSSSVASAAATATTRMRAFANANSATAGSFWPGSISDILYYIGVPSAARHAQIVAYLNRFKSVLA